jgi:lysozyme family protein
MSLFGRLFTAKAPKPDKFETVMEFVMRWEGGYVNHPDDPGGETNFGIAKRSHPDVDIKNLTKEGAKAIYRKEYWDKLRGDDLPLPVALAVMDYGVNSGVMRAAKQLQKSIGASPDGDIGPNTLKALERAVAAKGAKAIAQGVVMKRVIFLTGLVKKGGSRLAFLTGWMKRTHQCMAKVSE